ncbi:MAG: hypothetical protein WDZ52_01295 [Pseudohongiellaceae bacterium]
MKTNFKHLITFIVIAWLPSVGAAQAEQGSCELAARYFLLAQDSLEEADDAGAAEWLMGASTACPRFEYYQALGEIWMESLLESERAAAVDVFISAFDIAETDEQRSTALYSYAILLDREGDSRNALVIIARAQELAPENAEIAALATTIEAKIPNLVQGSVRAGNEVTFRPLTAEGEQQSSSLSAYPWPPERASWTVRIDDVASPTFVGMSLTDVESRLSRSLRSASYSMSRLYSAPGGFVMVTRLEATDSDGSPLPEAERYRLPDDGDTFQLGSYIRNLFFAPEGYYRFIAFVVSDQFERESDAPLSETDALERLQRGALRLPREYADMEFTESHRIEALIYEFRKGAEENDLETMLPGRIPADNHLQNSGLSSVLLE